MVKRGNSELLTLRRRIPWWIIIVMGVMCRGRFFEACGNC